MNEAAAGLMQRDALPGPIILRRTDRVIRSGVSVLSSGTSAVITLQSQLNQNERG